MTDRDDHLRRGLQDLAAAAPPPPPFAEMLAPHTRHPRFARRRLAAVALSGAVAALAAVSLVRPPQVATTRASPSDPRLAGVPDLDSTIALARRVADYRVTWSQP